MTGPDWRTLSRKPLAKKALERLSIRLTMAQKERIASMAEQAGLTITNLILHRLLRAPKKPIDNAPKTEPFDNKSTP